MQIRRPIRTSGDFGYLGPYLRKLREDAICQGHWLVPVEFESAMWRWFRQAERMSRAVCLHAVLYSRCSYAKFLHTKIPIVFLDR